MLNVQLLRFMRGIWKFSAEARVGDTLVAEAELMCTVRKLK
jgi:3-hydroxyacyl-[acyl-carrier-protein] dehydratase